MGRDLTLSDLRDILDDLAALPNVAVHLEALLSAIHIEWIKEGIEHAEKQLNEVEKKLDKREVEKARREMSLVKLLHDVLQNLGEVEKRLEDILSVMPRRYSLSNIAQSALQKARDVKRYIGSRRAFSEGDRKRSLSLLRQSRRLLRDLKSQIRYETIKLACTKARMRVQRLSPQLTHELELPKGWILRKVWARLKTRGLMGTQLLPWSALFDIGIFWDPILQLPYYPGSTVKGAVHGLFFSPELVVEAVKEALKEEVSAVEALAKSLVVLGVSNWEEDVVKPLKSSGLKHEELEELKRKVKEEVKARLRVDLLLDVGEWRWRGSVIFFDAYPDSLGENGWLLVPETITPHYKEEVKEGKMYPEFAEHRVSPTPLTFLAVERGVRFTFPLAGRSNEELDIAEELLKTALTNIGIGAKTTSGYNIFEFEEKKK